MNNSLTHVKILNVYRFSRQTATMNNTSTEQQIIQHIHIQSVISRMILSLEIPCQQAEPS